MIYLPSYCNLAVDLHRVFEIKSYWKGTKLVSDGHSLCCFRVKLALYGLYPELSTLETN